MDDALLLDLGNTRLKWALWRGGALGAVAATTLDALRALPHADHALIAASNADPAVQARLDDALAKAGITRIERIGPPHDDALLRLAYAEPATLGVDRWLAMRAARRRVDGAFLLASVGTALTLDAVDAAGRHLGGLIAPSPACMREALLGRAAHLRRPGGRLREFADNTADAVHSGSLLAAAVLVERLHEQLARRLDQSPALILGGGGADELRPALRIESRIQPDLVLQGLADWLTFEPP